MNFTTEICTAPQGSQQWLADRAGVITASKFKLTRERIKSGPNKGNYKAEALKYIDQLAFERLTGEVLDDNKYETPYMTRGKELESDAREAHELKIGTMVEEAGFIRTTDRRFGVSVDGFIRGVGGAEYKCFVAPDKVANILIYDDVSEVIDQVQGGMWLTGLNWWHYGLYHPALSSLGIDIKLIEMERDDDYIEELESDLITFDRFVEARVDEMREATSKVVQLKFPAASQPKVAANYF